MHSLSPQQTAVVTTIDAACCVLSIPGSGKTRVVTEKIVYLLSGHEIGLWPRPMSVLAVTFTAEAAKELATRTASRLSKQAVARLRTGTFHSVFLQALKRVGASVASRRLASPGQAQQYLDRALAECAPPGYLSANTHQARQQLRAKVEQARTILAKPLDTNKVAGLPYRDISADEFAPTIEEYGRLMEEAGLLDFNMILEFSLEFLRNSGQTVRRTPIYDEMRSRHLLEHGYAYEWSEEFKVFAGATHVLVDEAQDIDAIQLSILLLLSDGGVMVDLVGDDDQSIYRFRSGLGLIGIGHFQAKTLAKLLKLETNYRCHSEILLLAAAVIEQNTRRERKDLIAHRGAGGNVTLDRFMVGDVELETVGRNISQLHTTAQVDGLPPPSVGVLARTNKILQLVELEFTKREIKYERVGGASIWGDQPVCFFLGYLEGLLRGSDRHSLDQCLYWAGVDTSLVDLQTLTCMPTLSSDARLIVERLAETTLFCRGHANSSAPKHVAAIVRRAHKWFIFVIEVQRTWTASQREYFQSVLTAAAHVLCGKAEVPEPGARNGLTGSLAQRLLSVKALDRTGKGDGRAVKLVSMHGAKGLEFDHVWIVACDDQTIPGGALKHEPDPGAVLEEERRLLYVAITRAKNSLHISWSLSPVHRAHSKKPAQLCRFLSSLDPRSRPSPTPQ